MADHCVFLRAGDLSAIVGDDTVRGRGGPNYSGLWSLVHDSSPASPFQGADAGLIASTHRGTGPTLEPLDGQSARLVRGPCDRNPHATVRGTYHLVAPHYVDYTCEVEFTTDASPPEYQRHDWERRTEADRFAQQRGFPESFSGKSFDYPFYYGQLHGLVYLLMADVHSDFRFFISPSGGGYSAIPGRTSPAWDFEWLIWNPEPGQTRTLNLRLALFPPCKSALPQQVWAEWTAFCEAFPTRSSS